MEKRVNSLETDLELLKKDMFACQASLKQDILHLKDTRAELPQWLKYFFSDYCISMVGISDNCRAK